MTTDYEIYEGMQDYIEHLQEKEARRKQRARKIQENRMKRKQIRSGLKINWKEK